MNFSNDYGFNQIAFTIKFQMLGTIIAGELKRTCVIDMMNTDILKLFLAQLYVGGNTHL
jgi:hypothetical protein